MITNSEYSEYCWILGVSRRAAENPTAHSEVRLHATPAPPPPSSLPLALAPSLARWPAREPEPEPERCPEHSVDGVRLRHSLCAGGNAVAWNQQGVLRAARACRPDLAPAQGLIPTVPRTTEWSMELWATLICLPPRPELSRV